MNKGISVIIPTYNRQDLVPIAIQSVLNQEYDGEIEIIISDDGSTDKTVEIAKSFGDKILIVEKPKNYNHRGAACARNRGIKSATKHYICFLDSDDFFLPLHLRKIVLAIERNPEAGFAFCRVLDYKRVGNDEFFRPWTMLHVLENDILNLVVARSQIVHTNSLIIKREVFKKVGMFNEKYKNVEDSDMWMRISEEYAGEFANHYGAIYQTNSEQNDQLHKTPSEKWMGSYIEVFENALLRYEKLKMNNSYRYYKIRTRLIHAKYRKNRITRNFYRLFLIIKFPFQFVYDLKVSEIEKKDKIRMQKWRDLSSFIDD